MLGSGELQSLCPLVVAEGCSKNIYLKQRTSNFTHLKSFKKNLKLFREHKLKGKRSWISTCCSSSASDSAAAQPDGAGR